MPKVVSWIRECDESCFDRFFSAHPGVEVSNARRDPINLGSEPDSRLSEPDWHALLLTGGEDISAPFLKQEISVPSHIKEPQPQRDAWEFEALKQALETGRPVLAICRGHQILNVALGGTLHLDIRGHDLPELKSTNVQPMRYASGAKHRFEQVNSSHHQAVDQLGDGLEVEGWCTSDGVIEQIRLREHPFVLGVQYHPERDAVYTGLFAEFFEYASQYE